MLRATTVCTFSTSQLPKVLRRWCAFYVLTSTCTSRHNGVHFFDMSTAKSALRMVYILTSKCASRHNGIHFFDMLTSKSGPSMVCFVHFDLDMCFAPQRRALFRNSTSEPPKVVRTPGVLHILTCFAPQRRALFRHLNFQKCSERCVHLAFSLANVLRATTACNFSSLIWPDGSAPAALASLLFDPPEPQIIGKT